MTTFIGSSSADTIVPGLVSGGVTAIGPDATPGAGIDLILSRGDDDSIAGGQGDDAAALGAGDDVFGWAPGDGSDTVLGQAGFDVLDFDGNGTAEVFALSHANGVTRFDRDVGDIAMRLAGIERVALFAGGGADVVRVGGMTGPDVQELTLDLSATEGARSGDGAADRIEVSDGGGDSFVSILGSGDTAAILGLEAFVSVKRPRRATPLPSGQAPAGTTCRSAATWFCGLRSMRAWATTLCPAARATICCAAGRATISSPGGAATTGRPWAWATTSSSGKTATAATWWTAARHQTLRIRPPSTRRFWPVM